MSHPIRSERRCYGFRVHRDGQVTHSREWARGAFLVPLTEDEYRKETA